MKYKDYEVASERTCPDLGTNLNNEMHMVIGISTESGELLDAYKKRFAYGKEVDLINVKEEIGDLMWYISNLCRMKGFNLEEIMATNINKLMVRFPEKFSQENALNRDLEQERIILT